MKQLLLHARLFDGTQFHAGKAVTIDGGFIDQIIERSILPGGFELHDLTGLVLAPGFIDCCLYGGGGQMIGPNTALTDLATIAEAHRAYGTTTMLPTVTASNVESVAHMASLAQQAHTYWGENSALAAIKGLHFEGPYLNPTFARALAAETIQIIDDSQRDAMIASMAHPDIGVRLVTLAPEKAEPGIIKQLSEAGAMVAAGSSGASHQETIQASRAGLRGVMQLFNQMPSMTASEPGLLGAALDDEDLWCSLLADGFHAHPAALRAAIKAKPKGKMMLMTGALATVGWDQTRFAFHDRAIALRRGVCVFDDGSLAGAHFSMIEALRNAVELLCLPLSEALRMVSLYPAQFLRLDMTHGMIAPGYAADLVAFDPESWTVKHSWINGYHRAHN